MRIGPLSVRARLTLWHAGVLTLVICVFAVGVLLFVGARLYRVLDDQIRADLATIEGMAKDGQLHPLQEGFWEEHGLQCGYCTPGMIMCSHQLLSRNASPDEAEIREALAGNLCRCTGYQNIVKAVQSASRKLKRAPRVAAGD